MLKKDLSFSEPLLLEHKKVVVDMISRSFADKGDLTTLANVTYDNIAEQVSTLVSLIDVLAWSQCSVILTSSIIWIDYGFAIVD